MCENNSKTMSLKATARDEETSEVPNPTSHKATARDEETSEELDKTVPIHDVLRQSPPNTDRAWATLSPHQRLEARVFGSRIHSFFFWPLHAYAGPGAKANNIKSYSDTYYNTQVSKSTLIFNQPCSEADLYKRIILGTSKS